MKLQTRFKSRFASLLSSLNILCLLAFSLPIGRSLGAPLDPQDVWTICSTYPYYHATTRITHLGAPQAEFIAGGPPGTILVSSNGCDWLSHPTTLPAEFSLFAYGNGQFAAAVTTNRLWGIAVSSNLTDWILAVPLIPDPWDDLIYAVDDLIFAGGSFVAVGWSLTDGHIILHSSNGQTWSRVPLPPPNDWEVGRLAYGNGRVVITCSDANSLEFFVSTNGLDWQPVQVNSEGGVYDIAFGNGGFVAVGDFNIFTSPDGRTWTARQLPGGLYREGPYFPDHIAFGDGRFLLSTWSVNPVGDPVAYLWTSEDARNWSQRSIDDPEPDELGRSSLSLIYGQGAFFMFQSDYFFGVYRSPFVSPRLSRPSFDPHLGLQVTVTGMTGSSYTLQCSTALPATNWTSLASFTLNTASTNLIDTNATSTSQRFYRISSP